jgi:hypothetical protein
MLVKQKKEEITMFLFKVDRLVKNKKLNDQIYEKSESYI